MQAIKRLTIAPRHALAKLLAPTLLKEYSPTSPTSRKRPMTAFIKAFMGNKELIGVEIGVFTGTNALSILRTLRMKRLFLIDSYEPYDDPSGIEMTENIKTEAERKLAAYNSQIQWIFLTSEQAIEYIPDNLDFVYIDGNHNYEYVTKDIATYYKKLRSGGVLGGHDFSLNVYREVVYAAVEFARANNLTLYGKESDFWVIKP